MAKGSNITKTAVWVLMGLLILGLGGFGATNLSGTIRSVGSVGDKSVPVDRYASQLQQEIRAVEAETGQSLPFARAQEIGLDRAVLQRLVRIRALDHEADQLGLSIGDAALRDRILEIQAFQGVDGSFDREGYRFALEQSGLSESQFETQLREEAARTLLQGAIVSGVVMPDVYAQTLVDYVGEQRSFTLARLGAEALDAPLPTPSEDELRAYYDDNIDAFTLPETKVITYAVLTPDALVDQVEVDENALREAYDARADTFNQPERRLVERLVYLDQDNADRAAASLEVSGSTFEQLVEERGLSLSDIDLGDMSEAELGAAGEAVFAADVGDVVGPLDSDLGPALFRVNGVLPAQATSFEEALEVLQPELAADRAQRVIEAQVQNLDDLLAGGATLEELAEETDMELGTIDWTRDSSDGIAAYEAFRDTAAGVTMDDFPEIAELDDGGIFALRVNEVLPPRPEPFEDARDAVQAAWEQEQTEAKLRTQAEALASQLSEGTDFAELELEPESTEGQTRNGFVEGTPPDFMEQVFAMTPGEVRVMGAEGTVLLVRLDDVTPAGDDPQAKALTAQLSAQINQTLAQSLFDVYASDVAARAGTQIDQRALNAVHVNFP